MHGGKFKPKRVLIIPESKTIVVGFCSENVFNGVNGNKIREARSSGEAASRDAKLLSDLVW